MFTKLISASEDGYTEVRLTVREFRGKLYLSLREWYLDFEEEWQPGKNGFTWELSDTILDRFIDAFKHLFSDKELQELGDLLEDEED